LDDYLVWVEKDSLGINLMKTATLKASLPCPLQQQTLLIPIKAPDGLYGHSSYLIRLGEIDLEGITDKRE
jgi:hypothetical protein